jgi:hypothetical protein
MWLSLAMNGFYGLKRVTGNLPAVVPPMDAGLIDHPGPRAEHGESSASIMLGAAAISMSESRQ